jgi:hypothetical protein
MTFEMSDGFPLNPKHLATTEERALLRDRHFYRYNARAIRNPSLQRK